MRLSAFRRWSRVIAAVLLCATAGLPHLAADDVACVPAVVSSPGDHDETQHSFRSGAPPTEREHCAICHWSRSLRSPRTSLVVATAEVKPPYILSRSSEARLESAILENLPARAPPRQSL